MQQRTSVKALVYLASKLQSTIHQKSGFVATHARILDIDKWLTIF